MEPNNFEKDFREKLNERKIEPSNKAWDRLDAMLSVTEEKKPEKSKKWLYIAASIVGFLLLGTFYFSQKESAAEMPGKTIVVEDNIKKDSVEKPILSTIDSSKTEIVISEKNPASKVVKEQKNFNQKTNKISTNESNKIAESSVIIKNDQEKQSINNQTVIAETPKKENIDQLLDSAEKTVIAENSVKPKPKVKINANDLLDQVDGELELSFREKMITKINRSYHTVKVAVENRNVKK
jgi:hypothetical protein